MLSVDVVLGELCTMIGLLIYSIVVNIKAGKVSNEIYVLIGGLTFTDILYIALCGYNIVGILRNYHNIKQFIIQLLLSISIGIIMVMTTYNYFYVTITPPVSFELTCSFFYEIFLLGLSFLMFGGYDGIGAFKYNSLAEAQTDNQIESTHQDARKSIDIQRKQEPSQHKKLSTNSSIQIEMDEQNIDVNNIQQNGTSNIIYDEDTAISL